MNFQLLNSAILTLLCLLPLQAFSATQLMMFNSDYCTWCHQWEEDIGGIYHLTPESCQAPLERYDFDSGEYPESLTMTEPVIYTPTFVLFHNQQEVGRITGYPGPDFFWIELDDLIKSNLSEPIRLSNSQNCSQS